MAEPQSHRTVREISREAGIGYQFHGLFIQTVLQYFEYLLNVIKIDPYNFELYCFKVGAFLRHSVFGI